MTSSVTGCGLAMSTADDGGTSKARGLGIGNQAGTRTAEIWTTIETGAIIMKTITTTRETRTITEITEIDTTVLEEITTTPMVASAGIKSYWLISINQHLLHLIFNDNGSILQIYCLHLIVYSWVIYNDTL